MATWSTQTAPDTIIVNEPIWEGVDAPLQGLGGFTGVPHPELDLAGNAGGCHYTAFGGGCGGGRKRRPELNLGAGAPFEMYDMRGRWWVPQIGAYLSPDELRYHDRDSTLWGWPRQNPYRWSDPSGHFLLPAAAAAAAAGGGVGLGGVALVGGTVLTLGAADFLIWETFGYQAAQLYDDLNTPTSGYTGLPNDGPCISGGGGIGGGGAPPLPPPVSGGGGSSRDAGAGPGFPGFDPAQQPGPDWQWRGNGPAGSPQGAWYNATTDESLHPDLNHPDPIGPHWDYINPAGNEWRIMPSGTLVPKP